MKLRLANSRDKEAIQYVYKSAFAEDERDLVTELAVNLLDDSMPTTFSWVAETEKDGAVVAHVAFSPVTTEDTSFRGYIVAPLAVQADHQKEGIGSALVTNGIKKLSADGIHVVFVYGDPKYYGRFGFSVEAASLYTTPYPLEYPSGWQALVLNETPNRQQSQKIACLPAFSNPQLW